MTLIFSPSPAILLRDARLEDPAELVCIFFGTSKESFSNPVDPYRMIWISLPETEVAL